MSSCAWKNALPAPPSRPASAGGPSLALVADAGYMVSGAGALVLDEFGRMDLHAARSVPGSPLTSEDEGREMNRRLFAAALA